MSQPGSTIEISELEDGTSWALLATSEIEGGSNLIMAASVDLVNIIEDGRGEELCIFPHAVSAGLYLWTGTLAQALEGDGEEAEMIHPSSMQHWLDHNGE